jgi:putative spermidine/putrescine transport system permease protein
MSAPNSKRGSYFLITPMAVIFAIFLVVPLLTIVVVSFWNYDEYRILPDFIFENYSYLLGSSVTWQIYLNTFKYAALTWAFTLGIGFTVAYFLAFHVRSLTWQIILFMVCTIPFWTSNIIRMISWIPFLGRNGLLNQALMGTGIIHEPLEFLLFSDFAVVLADFQFDDAH